jgi:hypothetical protein
VDVDLMRPAGDLGAGERWARFGVLVALACAGGLLLVRDGGSPGSELPHWTIYPWWLLVLALLGVLAAAWSVFSPSPVVPLAVAGVVAAHVAGSAFVGAKHWAAVNGIIGGAPGDRFSFQVMALAMSASAVAALGLCTWLMVRTGALQLALGRVKPSGTLLLGAAIVLLLPFGVAAGDPQALDVTSLVAFALVYSLPWGLVLMLKPLAEPTPYRAAVGTCGAAAVMAAIGPQMASLVFGNARPALAASAAVLLATAMMTRPDGSPSLPGPRR